MESEENEFVDESDLKLAVLKYCHEKCEKFYKKYKDVFFKLKKQETVLNFKHLFISLQKDILQVLFDLMDEKTTFEELISPTTQEKSNSPLSHEVENKEDPKKTKLVEIIINTHRIMF